MSNEYLVDVNKKCSLNANNLTGHVLLIENGIIKIVDRFGKLVCSFTAKDLPRVNAKNVIHAHWREDTFCSNCGYFAEDYDGHIIMSNTDYCPGCGAVMDEMKGNGETK